MISPFQLTQPDLKTRLSLKKSNFPELLKHKIPLFAKINSHLLNIIDLTGFVVFEGIIEIYRKNLEDKLGHFVVSYDKEVCNLDVPVEAHLCARVKGAELTLKQKKLLERYELLSKPLGVTFVVYQNPVEYIDPCQSAIYSLYKETLLLGNKQKGLV